MKKTLKGPAIVFFLLALIFTVAWIAVFVVYGLLLEGVNFQFPAMFEAWIKPQIDLIMPFFKGELYGFTPDKGEFFYLTYIGFGLLGIMLILMIIGLILSIKRKRARYIPFGLIMLVAAVAAFEFVLYLPYFKTNNFLSFDFSNPVLLSGIIFTWALALCAGLAYIFSIVEFFVGLARAKRLLACNGEPAELPGEEVAPSEPVEEQPAQDVNELFATAPASNDEFVATQPLEEEKSEDYDTMADFAAEPEEQFAQPEEIVVEEVPEQKDAITKDDLASILKDVVRDIVRDEIARANAAKEEESHPHCHRDGDHSITGATFGGPLVVQYFNGGINGQDTAPSYAPAPAPVVVQAAPAPAPAPVPAPAPAPAPKKEEKKPEPAPAPAPAPAPVVVPVPVVVEEKPAEEPVEKNPIIRIPFTERMLSADKEMKDNYNEIKNEIMSYGVNYRVSNSGDTFRLHRKTYVKVTIAGKSLKLYFALDPADYADSKMPIGDASKHAVYAETPLIFKVKSGLSVRRAKELIRDVMSKDGLEQGEVGSVNWVKELKANQK